MLHNDHELLQWKVAYQKQPYETPVSYIKHFSCTWQALLRRNCLVQREIQRRNERAKAMQGRPYAVKLSGKVIEVKLSFPQLELVLQGP